MGTTKTYTEQLAKEYAQKGNPNGWFEEFYAEAGGDFQKIYWADLKPNPLLVDWMEGNTPADGARAVVIGCGLGDDAEAMSSHGYAVTAFDISPSAIEMCQRRFPKSSVEYVVADLFALPADWHHGFSLVFECNTVQILKDPDRTRAIAAITDLVAPEGCVVVSCRSRNAGEGLDDFPVALDHDEIDMFNAEHMTGIHFLAYDDDQDPPVPHFFAVYKRVSE